MLTDQDYAAITDVLDKFDFDKVHSAMVALGWKWVIWGSDGDFTYAIPDVARIKDHAASLLCSCRAHGSYSSGGFTAEYRELGYAGEGKRYRLRFCVEDRYSSEAVEK